MPRKLRIAVSVFFGLLTVVLWVHDKGRTGVKSESLLMTGNESSELQLTPEFILRSIDDICGRVVVHAHRQSPSRSVPAALLPESFVAARQVEDCNIRSIVAGTLRVPQLSRQYATI